uniref:Large ribosomal subunit protein mL64 n=1 Tax=Neovison vison TaxID=452646 RepID=A0A8C7BEQ8_NEOVI
MQELLQVQQLAEEQKRQSRKQLIAERMAKLPQMIENWRRQQQEHREKEQAYKERQARLQVEAQDRLGYHVHPRSAPFQMLLQDLEKQQRKRLKEEKQRRRRHELQTTSTGICWVWRLQAGLCARDRDA